MKIVSGFLLVIILSLNVSPAVAFSNGWLTINPLEIDVLLTFNYWGRDYQNADTNQSEWEGGFRLAQEGFIFDPGILEFSYYLEPRYVSGYNKYPSYKEDISNDYLNYYVTLDWLQGSTLPVRGSFVFSNFSQNLTGSLGRKAEIRTSHYMASLSWLNSWLPTDFIFENRDLYSISTAAPGSIPRINDQENDIFRIRAKNKRLSLDMESRRTDDQVPGRNNDFNVDRATLLHQLSWGKGSFLNSRYHIYDRNGFNPVKLQNFSERFQVWHLENLFSRLEYLYQSSEQTQKTTSNELTYWLGHNVYQNLTSTGRFSLREVKSNDLLQTEELVGIDVAYRKSNIKGADVNASLGASYSYNDRDSKLGLREVIDEPHSVPLSREVVLDSRFILTSTITVTNADSSRVYIRGIDYEVGSLDNNLTQLQILPGGEIQTGDLILVSYTFVRAPSAEYNRLTTRGSLNFRLGNFSLRYYGNATRYDVISGLGGAFLSDTRDSTLRIDYFWDSTKTKTQISAERRVYSNGSFKGETYTFGQSFSLDLRGSSRLSISLSQSFSDNGSEDVSVYIADILMDWKPTPNLTIRPTLGVWKYDVANPISEANSNEDQIITAGLTMMWSYRLLSADLSYYHNNRTTNGANTVTDSLYINFRRRFR